MIPPDPIVICLKGCALAVAGAPAEDAGDVVAGAEGEDGDGGLVGVPWGTGGAVGERRR